MLSVNCEDFLKNEEVFFLAASFLQFSHFYFAYYAILFKFIIKQHFRCPLSYTFVILQQDYSPKHAFEDADIFFVMTRENNISFAALPQEKRSQDNSRKQQLDYRTEYMYFFVEIKHFFPLIYKPNLLLCLNSTYSFHCISF